MKSLCIIYLGNLSISFIFAMSDISNCMEDSLSVTSQPHTSANRPDRNLTLVAERGYIEAPLPIWYGNGYERKW